MALHEPTAPLAARSVTILHDVAPAGWTWIPEYEDAALKAAAEAADLSRWPTYEELANAYQRGIRRLQEDKNATPPALWQEANDDLRAMARHLMSQPNETLEEHGQVTDDAMFGPVAPGMLAGTGCCQDGLAAILYTPNIVRNPITKEERVEYFPSTESPAYVLRLWLITLKLGYRGPYPWNKLVRWWHEEEPIEINETNDRPDPILPAPLIMVKRDSQLARLYSPAARLVRQKDGQAYLPGFAPGEEWGSKQPCLPLALYDLGVKNAKYPGRGAPIALRLFVETILSVPQEYRSDPRGVWLPPARLRDWIPLLYGNQGLKRYRPSSQWPRIRSAFESLLNHESRIPWYNPETDEGGARLVVMPVDIPRDGRLDDWVRFIVSLPPGSEKGPLIDRYALRKAGLNSAPAYRMALALSFTWHDRGRLRVPVDKRKQRWAQTRNEQRYPALSDEELVWMAYPTGTEVTVGTHRKQLQRSRKALAFLKDIGFAKRTPFDGIMPGPKWAGWGNREIVIPVSAS